MERFDLTVLTRRQWLGGAAALGAATAFQIPAWAQAPAPWANMQRLVDSYVGANKVCGMVAALGSAQREPVAICAGVDSFTGERHCDLDSIYRIYSQTKPITGMAAMILIDEGKLGLDQPLHEILPKFRNMRVQKVHDGAVTADNLEPAARAITIRQLLTHTSGLGYGIVQTGPIVGAFRAAGAVPGQFSRLQALIPTLAGTPAPSLEVFADNLAGLPLVYQPGTKWSYSMGLDVMGRVIEVVSGQPFDRFLQERFFDPLRMSDTGFQVPRDKADRLTASYAVANGRLLPIDLGPNSIYLETPAFPFGGAGLASTPRDYDRFLMMLAAYGQLGGTRVMSERAVRLGASNLLPDTLRPDGGYDEGWGFGAGGRVGLGDNAGIYGWAGAAGTFGFVDIPRQLRAGLYTQYLPVTAYPLSEEFAAAARADFAALARR